MSDYNVTWDIEAPNFNDPREAAEWALSMLRDPKQGATIFTVTNTETSGTCKIDAADDGLDDDYCPKCEGSTDGDGYDGYCGNCADKLEAQRHWG